MNRSFIFLCLFLAQQGRSADCDALRLANRFTSEFLVLQSLPDKWVPQSKTIQVSFGTLQRFKGSDFLIFMNNVSWQMSHILATHVSVTENTGGFSSLTKRSFEVKITGPQHVVQGFAKWIEENL